MLIEYLPEFLRNIKEFKEIFGVENDLFGYAQRNILQAENNQYYETADRYGIERYEKIMGIINNGESLEQRRQRVYYRFNNSLPYTAVKLLEQLELICGKGNAGLYFFYDEYILEIKISGNVNSDDLYEARLCLNRMIPANLINNIVLKNTHRILGKYRHRDIGKYTHRQLNEKNLERSDYYI